METIPKRILVVDDEEDIRDLIAYNLAKEHFIVTKAVDGLEAVRKLSEEEFDLVILDIMMPGLDGFDVCRHIRSKVSTAQLPVIFLTARSAEVDQVVSFELGADDYIQKPVSPRIIVARVKSVLRRMEHSNAPKPTQKQEQREKIVLDGLEIDKIAYKVFLHGNEIFLPKKEFELLFFLSSHPGRVYSRDALLNEVWGQDTFVVERTVDVHIFKVREKLGELGARIQTVKGVGYRFAT